MRVIKNKIIFLFIFVFISILFLIASYFYIYPIYKMKKISLDFYSGNLDLAIVQLEKLIKIPTVSADAYLFLATVYSQKGSVSFNEEEYAMKAISAAQKSLDLRPNNAEAYRVIGYSYEIMEKYSEAQSNYLRSIEINPNFSLAYSNLGHSYDLQGDINKAEEFYLKALSIDQYNFHALNNISRVYIRTDKPYDAEKYLKISVEKNPDNRMNAEAYQMLAIIEKNFRNDKQKSIEYLNKSLSYDQTVPQVWIELGMNKFSELPYVQEKEEWDAGLVEVETYITKALSINPNQTSAYLLSALLNSYKGEYSKAEEMRLKALDVVVQDITLGQKEKEEFKSILESIKALWVDYI